MKVNFLTSNPNLNSGSFRIWVHDLCSAFNEIGIESKIATKINQIDNDSDVIILCKSSYTLSSNVSKSFKGAKIGAINIDCRYYDENIDFVIVGSIEEYASISNYKNVFIFPLIERKFESKNLINHTDKKTFDVCFHGHYPHLFKFEPFVKRALERFDREIKPVNLRVITGNKNFNWQTGRPAVNIETYNYDDDFVEIVQSCDIGVVPNVCDMRILVKDLEKQISTDFGLYETDYFLRMKNKTNPGRAYVFYQLGVPVVHDLSPSSFELMCKTGYNICGHDSNSYYREFIRLSNPDLRNKVALKNKSVFEKYYDFKSHAKNLIQSIRKEVL